MFSLEITKLEFKQLCGECAINVHLRCALYLFMILVKQLNIIFNIFIVWIVHVRGIYYYIIIIIIFR